MEQLVANNALYSILIGIGGFIGGMALAMKFDMKFGWLIALGGLLLIGYSLSVQGLFG